MIERPHWQELPYIDEHAVTIKGDSAGVWDSLGHVLSGAFPRGSRALGRALDVRPLDPSGDPLEAGSTVRGFRVAHTEAGVDLALEGEHRLSRYALVFRLERVHPVGIRLRAETRAVFPRPAGHLYRFLVIGTGGHVLAVKRLLRAVQRRAEE